MPGTSNIVKTENSELDTHMVMQRGLLLLLALLFFMATACETTATPASSEIPAVAQSPEATLSNQSPIRIAGLPDKSTPVSKPTLDLTIADVSQQSSITADRGRVATATEGFTIRVVDVLFRNPATGERTAIGTHDAVLIYEADQPIKALGGGEFGNVCVGCFSVSGLDPGAQITFRFLFLVEAENAGLEYQLQFKDFPSVPVLLE